MLRRLANLGTVATLLLAIPADAVQDPKAEVVDFCVEVHVARIVDHLLATDERVSDLARDPQELRQFEAYMKAQWLRESQLAVRKWEQSVDWGIETGIDPDLVYREVKRLCLESAFEDDE